jgi:hypothetical protein
MCENLLEFYFFLNREFTIIVPDIIFFPRKKNWFSSLTILNSSRIIGFLADFLGWFSQAKFQNFQYFFLENYCLHYFLTKEIGFEYIFNNL